MRRAGERGFRREVDGALRGALRRDSVQSDRRGDRSRVADFNENVGFADAFAKKFGTFASRFADLGARDCGFAVADRFLSGWDAAEYASNSADVGERADFGFLFAGSRRRGARSVASRRFRDAFAGNDRRVGWKIARRALVFLVKKRRGAVPLVKVVKSCKNVKIVDFFIQKRRSSFETNDDFCALIVFCFFRCLWGRKAGRENRNLGTVLLRFSSMTEMLDKMDNMNSYIKVFVEEETTVIT